MPIDFTETLLTTGADLSSPTAMEIAPDNQVWVLEQGGAVKVLQANGTAHTALSISVDARGERGLLGIAFDPNYDGAGANEDYVYLYYTAPRGGTNDPPNNRITRWHVNGAGSGTPTLDSQVVIRELPPENEDNNLATDGDSNHNGGAMHFGPDGKLYVAVGDHNYDTTPQSNHVSQLINTPFGKMLRLNPDGTNVSDNPFYTGSASDWQGSIYALGLRNPYTFDISASGTMLINDVGENVWEEINLGERGANYGWAGSSSPLWEGFEDPDPTWGNYRDPIMAYSHAALGGCAITGGVFYPENGQFGSEYAGKYFFADYCGSWIRTFDPDNPGSQTTPDTSTPFASSLTTGFPVDLRVDSVGNLYYLSRGGPGEVYRISFRAPAITQQPTSQTINEGQSASFTVAATGGGTLAYQWQKLSGSTWGNIAGATSATYTIPSTTTGNAGQYRAVVTNSAGSVTSNAATLTVNVVGQAPTITQQPSNLSRNVGQSASFTVAASGTAPLTYQWQKLSGSTWNNIAGATSATYSIASVTTASAGQYRAVVTNTLGTATSGAVTLDVNQSPSATISVSSNTYTFGQTINFSAVASDPEDGLLPGSAYTWSVELGHDTHFHPHVAPFSGTSGSFVANFEERAPNQLYRIRLTVTDSDGASTSTFYDVTPVLVQLTLLSNPAGVPLTIDGTAGATFASVVGMPRTLQAPASYTIGGTNYTFANWSDGQPATHTIATPTANATYTANYVPVTGQGLRAEFFDFTAGLSVLPDLSSRTADVSRVDGQVNYTSTTSPWSGLDSRFADTFASRHSGLLRVDTTGAYTFYLNSDDGARLWIDGELVINNDGLHGMRELSATRTLTAGQHAIRLEYFENGGDAGLTLSWAGPSFTKQLVPTGALSPESQGLRAEFFDYTTALSTLPDLSTRTPDVVRIDTQLNYAGVTTAWVGLDSRFAETFASRHSGFVRTDAAGAYTFYLNSDDGSRLWIDGDLVIDNNDLHSIRELSATRTLTAGYHAIRVEYFENGGTAGLGLSWSGPGIAKQAIAAGNLSFQAPAVQQSTAADGLVVLEAERADGSTTVGGKSWQPYSATAGYSGSSALVVAPNTGINNDTNYVLNSPRLDYRINFNRTGTHYIWLRGIGATGNDDSVHFGLDGAAVATADRVSGWGTSYGWTKNTMDGPVTTVNITSVGLHTLNLWMREDGTVVDKIVLTTSASYVPSGMGPTESVRSGGAISSALRVDAAASIAGAHSESLPVAATESAIAQSAAAAWLEDNLQSLGSRFTGLLQIARPGEYTFHTKGELSVQLWIDGTPIPSSGDNSATVDLTAGFHKVVLEGDDAYEIVRAKLKWTGPGIAKQLIPNWLFLEMLG